MSKHITCTRRLQFCAGHRVYKHESKCANVHGHNYVLYATASAKSLDEIGRIIDFGVLKEKLGTWIDLYWDHGMLLWEEDPITELWTGTELTNHKVFLLPYNPTAENMALYLLEVVCPGLFEASGIRITEVIIHETENCSAEAKL